MKKIIIVIIGILLLSGCSNASAEEGNKQKVEVIERTAVEVSALETRERVGEITLPGKVEANSTHKLASLVSGQLETLSAEVGDFVDEGDVLAVIDDEFVRLQKEQADIGNSLYNLSLTSAKRTYERTVALYESGAITQAEYDSVTDMLTKAKLDYAKGQNSTSQINYQLRNMEIKAPFAGVISAKYQIPGASVAPGTPVYEIVDIKGVIVEAGVTEKNINRLKSGQQVQVELAAVNLDIEGTVEGVGPVPGSDGTYPVRVRIENEEGQIKPGMYADLKIETESPVPVLALPKIAVLHENGEDYVFVADGAQARKVKVEKGIAFDTFFEVESGLERGDLVIVSGQAYLDDGNPIDIIE